MGEFVGNVSNNDELCIKALNNLSRPPEIDEPFLEFFKPKPKLRIKSKSRGKSLDSSDVARASTSAFGEEVGNGELSGSYNIRNSFSTSRSELNTLDEGHDMESYIRDNRSIRRVRSEVGRLNRDNESTKAENLLSSILILPEKIGKKSDPRSEVRKRKLSNNGNSGVPMKDEFLSVVTPISPYVISPKSNNFNYSNTNVHNKDLTEKNIDLLKSLIEIKDKELTNLNTSYSYEKSELKLEIIRLKKIIKDSEESHLLLKKEVLEKEEALAESIRNYEKLEFDFSSTKQSLEIMLEAERNANQHLKQELMEKSMQESSFGYLGENSMMELQSYKMKYFEAMKKLQRLETEMVLSRAKGFIHGENRELLSNDSVPIFVGPSGATQPVFEYILHNLQASLEVCLNIKEEDIEEACKNTDVIQLVSENSLLQESLLKLREELEIEKNKSIVANIRHLTQKPILISSCTNTRLTMHEIEETKAKAKCFEQRYEQAGFEMSRNIVNIQIIKPKDPPLNIQKLNNIEIQECSSNFESKFDKSIQTHVDDNNNIHVHANTGNATNFVHDVGNDVDENNQRNQHINLYDLAFKDYNFVPKLLNNSYVNVNTLSVGIQHVENGEFGVSEEIKVDEKTSGSEFESFREDYTSSPIEVDSSRIYLICRKSEFFKKVLLELKYEIFELRNIVVNYMVVQPQYLMGMVDDFIKGGDMPKIDSSDFCEGKPLVNVVLVAILKVYSMYLSKVDQLKEFMLKDNEWKNYSDRLEAELNIYSLEKSELVNEISYLKRILNEKIEKEKTVTDTDHSERGIHIQRSNDNDDMMSCYTFGESSSVNLENEMEWTIDDINITKLISSRGNNINKSVLGQFGSELEIVEKSKSITQVNNESDSFNKIIKLQGRIRSFKQSRIKQESAESDEISSSGYQPEKSLIPFNKSVFRDNSEIANVQESIEFEDSNSLVFFHVPPQMSGGDLVDIGELKEMTGTAMMLRLYRYHNQIKLLEKQVSQLSKEKQKLELQYEKDAQTSQMSILSSKLIIEARDMEIKTLKEKCEFLSNKMEDDIKVIKSAAREEIEKVWKPRVEEINSKCEDYMFKVSSLESEILILRQQLAFQKQLNSKESKKNDYDNIIKGKYLASTNSDNYKKISRELIDKISRGVNSFELKVSTDHDNSSDQSDSITENDSININSCIETSRGDGCDEPDDQNISSLKSALSKLKTISNEYKSFN